MAPKSSSSMDEASSPFFLHPGDSLGIVLVTQSLIGDNYHSWCRSMHMVLSAKNKLGFVDGSILKPSYPVNTMLPSWLCCNNMDLNQWKLIGVGRYKGGLYFPQQSSSSTSDLFQTPSLPLHFILLRTMSFTSAQNILSLIAILYMTSFKLGFLRHFMLVLNINLLMLLLKPWAVTNSLH
ncbi:uncharacterized protein LOC122275606 [Carya illinoinensis]|uniref:uncharacterized protein LOC122275606 n=1 Tax=Carya illinoinensis TaxID=32201 RepID=UPI001C7242F6|nr:uncharacterized protein LOC122275606 [Carya illinoinensis]